MKAEADRLISERDNLQELQYSENVTIGYKNTLSMFDGKLAAILTGNITNQRCNLCHLLPREYKGKDVDEIVLTLRSALFTEEICTAPLHFGERVFDHLLKLGKLQSVKKYRNHSDFQKMVIELERLFIIDRLKHELGVLVDLPGTSGGNTTNGNTIRRCFENPKLLAKVLGISVKLVKAIIVIWKALRCGVRLDSTKFKKYCRMVLKMYEKEFPWAEMCPTLHLILHHGWMLLDAIPETMTIAMFNEEGLEAVNKKIKHYEVNRARQTSRRNRLSDTFQRINDFSYPVILDKIAQRKKKAKKSSILDQDVMLLLPDNDNDDVQDSDSESDDDNMDDTE